MKLLSPITNYLSWIIIFLLLSGNIFSQDFDWFNKHKKQQGQSIWVTSFPNTSSISPHNAYLRFNGLQLPYGNWARVFADASHQRGLQLIAVDIDRFKIKWDLKHLAPPKTTVALFGTGNYVGNTGWSISYYTIAGHKLSFISRGVQFNFDETRPGDGDTVWHTRYVTYTKPAGGAWVFNAYRTVVSGDSLTATQQDTVTNTIADTALTMAFGNSGGSPIVSDTTATTCVQSGAGLYGGLKNFWLIKGKNNRDTAYYYPLSEGYGDNTYPYVLTADSSLHAFDEPLTLAIALSRGATLLQSFLDYDRAGTGNGSSLVAFNGGFSGYDRYDGQWWDSVTNTRITTASKPSYIDTLGNTGYSGISYFVTTAGMNINSESYGLGMCIKDSFLIPCGHMNNINKTTVSGLGTSSPGIMKYNINSHVWSVFDATNFPLGTPITDCIYNSDLIIGMQLTSGAGSGDSIKNIARTRNLARWDWDTSSWKALDSGFNSDVYMVKGFGNALFAGGAFTASGNTTVNRVAIMRSPYGEWKPLGTGANNTVWSFHVTQAGDTLIGGSFSDFNGVTVTNICKWNGSTAIPLGTNLDGTVFTIMEYKGLSYAGGAFTGGVSYWDGSTWQTAFGGVTFGASSVDCAVIDMKIGKVFSGGIQVDSVLIVTGQFTKVGSTVCGRQFIYNGRDIIPCPWIDLRTEEAVTYNPAGSDTLYIYTAGDNYGIYGVSTQNVHGLKVVFTK